MINEKMIFKKFQLKRVLTIDQLIDLLKCSAITVRRYLKKWKAYTSINKNGRYYVLPQIPKFDKNGLWGYQTILFSKNGNLKKTIIHLVKHSEAGLNTLETSKVVGLPQKSSYMSRLMDLAEIRREKHQRKYIYFSNDLEIYSRQKHKRILLTQESKKFPSDAEAVVILVQFIKHPDSNMQELSNKVAKQGVMIDTEMIKRFLKYHDLVEKKTVMKP